MQNRSQQHFQSTETRNRSISYWIWLYIFFCVAPIQFTRMLRLVSKRTLQVDTIYLPEAACQHLICSQIILSMSFFVVSVDFTTFTGGRDVTS